MCLEKLTEKFKTDLKFQRRFWTNILLSSVEKIKREVRKVKILSIHSEAINEKGFFVALPDIYTTILNFESVYGGCEEL